MTNSSTQNGKAEDTELDTARSKAGFAVPTDRSFLHITGEDAARWLNGMVTNAAQTLAPGTGNYNFLLNAQGRIQGDCVLFRDPSASAAPEFLLITESGQGDAVQRHLDKYIIMDDVELSPAFTDQVSLTLVGPDAAEQLHALGLPSLDPLHLAHAEEPFGSVLIFTPPPAGLPQFELRAAASVIEVIRGKLLHAGVPELSLETLEQLRVIQGTPRFGVDIRDRELPQETAQAHALHFAKGCYLGQEIVERIRSRGQVHRQFTAFRLEGMLPATPASLEADGKVVGELTSAAVVPADGTSALLALGYIRREVLEAHTPLSYAGGTAVPRKPGHVA